MGLLKIHNGGNNAHAQDSTVITSVGVQIQLNLQERFTSMISSDLRCVPIPLLWKKIRVEVFLRIFTDDQKVE